MLLFFASSYSLCFVVFVVAFVFAVARPFVFAVACPFVCHPVGICCCRCFCPCFCRCPCFYRRCCCLWEGAEGFSPPKNDRTKGCFSPGPSLHRPQPF